jgi:hypothetical protein
MRIIRFARSSDGVIMLPDAVSKALDRERLTSSTAVGPVHLGSEEFVRDRLAVAAAVCLPSVRPLIVPSDAKEATPIGSATLLWWRGKRYVVTAAHVIEPYKDRGCLLTTKTTFVPMPTLWRLTAAPGGNRNADTFDFAFAEIDDECAARLDGCEFLSASRVESTRQTVLDGNTGETFVVYGYPQNRVIVDYRIRGTRVEALGYFSCWATESSYAPTKLSPDTHVMLHCPQNRSRDVGDRHFGPTRMLSGMSGGGMFRIPPCSLPTDVAPPVLSAITIEQRADRKLLIGIRIDRVLRTISAAHAT